MIYSPCGLEQKCGNLDSCLLCHNGNKFKPHKGAKFEKKIAQLRTRAIRDPQSGAFIKGDVKDTVVIHECKETSKQSIGIRKTWLEKIISESSYKRLPVLVFRFVDMEPFVILRYSDFNEILKSDNID